MTATSEDSDLPDETDPADAVERLGREVYGHDFEKFLTTPRRSLQWETPRALLERGEYEPVLLILKSAANGHFS